MAKNATIQMVIIEDDDGNLDKLLSTQIPHTGRGGTFLWQVQNGTQDTHRVGVDDFLPAAYIDILTTNPVPIPPGQTRVIVGRVVNAQKTATTVTYSVYVDRARLDPDLIVDGDGSNIPPGHRKGKSRKKKAAKKR